MYVQSNKSEQDARRQQRQPVRSPRVVRKRRALQQSKPDARETTPRTRYVPTLRAACLLRKRLISGCSIPTLYHLHINTHCHFILALDPAPAPAPAAVTGVEGRLVLAPQRALQKGVPVLRATLGTQHDVLRRRAAVLRLKQPVVVRRERALLEGNPTKRAVVAVREKVLGHDVRRAKNRERTCLAIALFPLTFIEEPNHFVAARHELNAR